MLRRRGGRRECSWRVRVPNPGCLRLGPFWRLGWPWWVKAWSWGGRRRRWRCGVGAGRHYRRFGKALLGSIRSWGCQLQGIIENTPVIFYAWSLFFLIFSYISWQYRLSQNNNSQPLQAVGQQLAWDTHFTPIFATTNYSTRSSLHQIGLGYWTPIYLRSTLYKADYLH